MQQGFRGASQSHKKWPIWIKELTFRDGLPPPPPHASRELQSKNDSLFIRIWHCGIFSRWKLESWADVGTEVSLHQPATIVQIRPFVYHSPTLFVRSFPTFEFSSVFCIISLFYSYISSFSDSWLFIGGKGRGNEPLPPHVSQLRSAFSESIDSKRGPSF